MSTFSSATCGLAGAPSPGPYHAAGTQQASDPVGEPLALAADLARDLRGGEGAEGAVALVARLEQLVQVTAVERVELRHDRRAQTPRRLFGVDVGAGARAPG